MANEPHRRHRVRLLATALGAAGVTLVTSCSSGALGHASPKHDSNSVLPGMPGMTGTEMPSMPGMSMPPTSGPAAPASAPAAAGANQVAIQGFAFSPQKITVKVGTTVTWTNRDQDAHTVTAKSGPFHSKALNTGGTFTYTFTSAGSYDYYCTIHPFMTATVVVTK
jgi:plastocyanin